VLGKIDATDVEEAIQILMESDKLPYNIARSILIKCISDPSYMIYIPCEGCLIIFRRATDLMVEVHICISKPSRDLRRSLKVLMSDLHNTTKYKTIIAYLPVNLKSLERLVVHLGFQQCGYLKDSTISQEQIQDLKIFVIHLEEI